MERAIGVVVGLGATYLFLSVVVLAIVEAIAQLLALRATSLRDCLKAILDGSASGPGLFAKLWKNPLLATLGTATGVRSRLPSQIPTPLFVSAFLDALVTVRAKGPELDAAYQEALSKLPAHDRELVVAVVGSTLTSIEEAEQRVGRWFDAVMRQLSEAYRRNVQWITRGFAVVIVLAVNADALTIGATFWRDSVAREAAIGLAARELELCAEPAPLSARPQAAPGPGNPAPTPPTSVCWELLEATAAQVPIPLGWTAKAWHEVWRSPQNVLTSLLGLVLSIIAVCLGAPFWFDVLRRITSLSRPGAVAAQLPSSGPPQAP